MDLSVSTHMTSGIPSHKTAFVPQSPVFSLFYNQEIHSYSSRFPNSTKEELLYMMYSNFQNDKELQRKYKHLYEMNLSQEKQLLSTTHSSSLSTEDMNGNRIELQSSSSFSSNKYHSIFSFYIALYG